MFQNYSCVLHKRASGHTDCLLLYIINGKYWSKTEPAVMRKVIIFRHKHGNYDTRLLSDVMVAMRKQSRRLSIYLFKQRRMVAAHISQTPQFWSCYLPCFIRAQLRPAMIVCISMIQLDFVFRISTFAPWSLIMIVLWMVLLILLNTPSNHIIPYVSNFWPLFFLLHRAQKTCTDVSINPKTRKESNEVNASVINWLVSKEDKTTVICDAPPSAFVSYSLSHQFRYLHILHYFKGRGFRTF